MDDCKLSIQSSSSAGSRQVSDAAHLWPTLFFDPSSPAKCWVAGSCFWAKQPLVSILLLRMVPSPLAFSSFSYSRSTILSQSPSFYEGHSAISISLDPCNNAFPLELSILGHLQRQTRNSCLFSLTTLCTFVPRP